MRFRLWPAVKPAAAVIISLLATTALPATASLAAQVAPATTAQATYLSYYHRQAPQNLLARTSSYIVRRGDTLSAIAAKYHLSWEGLYWANRHTISGNPDMITPGERISLRTEAGYKPPVLRLAADVIRQTSSSRRVSGYAGSYSYSFTGLESLWDSAGGPSWAAPRAARIAMCESGGHSWETNHQSGAAGIWQILGEVVPGNVYNPYTNALNAVAKFRASGDTFAQWVCQG